MTADVSLSRRLLKFWAFESLRDEKARAISRRAMSSRVGSAGVCSCDRVQAELPFLRHGLP